MEKAGENCSTLNSQLKESPAVKLADECIPCSTNTETEKMYDTMNSETKSEHSIPEQVEFSSKLLKDEFPGKTFEDMNLKLERMTIPYQAKICDPSAVEPQPFEQSKSNLEEAIVPSAPLFEFEEPEQAQPEESFKEPVVFKEQLPKVQCMPLDKAIWMFGGEEIDEVRMLSEREEAAVQAGPISGPEHPLVDLLSTLR